MAKIDRYNGNMEAFAADALSTERTIFGDTAQSDTLDANITMDLLRGWGVIGVASNPTKQHFNGLAFTLGQLIAYLHQRGVPEWNAAQEYFDGSVVTTDVGVYRLKTGGDGSSDPDTDGGVNWELMPTQAKVDAKADKATTYSETEVDGLLDDKADQVTTYTKLETVAEFNQYGLGASALALDDANDMITPGTFGGPGDGSVNFPGLTQYGMLRVSGRSASSRSQEAFYGGDEFYIRYTDDYGVNWTDWEEVALLSEVNNLLDDKADQATTYTETEVDGLLDDKANISGQIFTGEINYRGAGGVTTNTGYGENVLHNNTTGGYNTANGRNALYYNTEGNSNTANGKYALVYNTTGNNNTACGHDSGRGIETGSGNSIFGANVAGLAPDLTDNLILASGGVIRLQHDGVETTTVQGDLVADNLSGTNTGDQTKADIDALNIDADTLDGLDSLDFVRDNGDSSMTGDYSTTGNIESGRASGGVALTINDSQGNANVTFNHADGVAEQVGNSGRITVNTDSTTAAAMIFEVLDNASIGTVNTLPIMNITENGVEVDQGNISAPNLSGTNTGDQTLSEIGVGQTWQDVKASRVSETTYTNTTGRPIMVTVQGAGDNNVTSSVDGIIVHPPARETDYASYIVPHLSSYKNECVSFDIWVELR